VAASGPPVVTTATIGRKASSTGADGIGVGVAVDVDVGVWVWAWVGVRPAPVPAPALWPGPGLGPGPGLVPGLGPGTGDALQTATVFANRVLKNASRFSVVYCAKSSIPSVTTKAEYLDGKDFAVASASNQELTRSVKVRSITFLTSTPSLLNKMVSTNLSNVSSVLLKMSKKIGKSRLVAVCPGSIPR